MFSVALQSALRQLQRLSRDGRSWIALGLLGSVVGLVGPFGTFAMPVALRLGYWIGMVFGTAVTGTLGASLASLLIGPRLSWLPRALLAGALAGLPVALLVVLLNRAVFGQVQPVEALALSLYCMLITIAITVSSAMFAAHHPPVLAATTAPALLDRLALPQRGRLLHLAMADHYVEVATDRGKALLLMRLSDAMRETAPIAGLQVHRSHWVALDAVRKAARQGGRPVLELENGTLVPISRSYLADAKAAGLLT